MEKNLDWIHFLIKFCDSSEGMFEFIRRELLDKVQLSGSVNYTEVQKRF